MKRHIRGQPIGFFRQTPQQPPQMRSPFSGMPPSNRPSNTQGSPFPHGPSSPPATSNPSPNLPSSSPTNPDSGSSSGPGGLEGLLGGAGNTDLSSLVKNLQQGMGLVKQVGPIIQQLGPIVKQIGPLLELLTSSSDSGSATEPAEASALQEGHSSQRDLPSRSRKRKRSTPKRQKRQRTRKRR